MNDAEQKGLVFNVQPYSVHDGPGIRTVVFFKGCPLRCHWCSNPESQNAGYEKGWNQDLCIGCSACSASCPASALQMSPEGIRRDADACIDCGACWQNCPSGAMARYGEEKSVGEILDDVERDTAFYSRSGGGITLSGGEPLFQPVFALAMLREAKARHLHRAMETCAICPTDIFLQAAGLLDYMLVDVKTLDREKHKAFTGLDCERAWENIRAVCAAGLDLKVHVRTPVVPGVNDSQDEIAAIAAFAREVGADAYDVLPYHRFGESKYRNLGRQYPMGDVKLDEEHFARLKQTAAREFNHA